MSSVFYVFNEVTVWSCELLFDIIMTSQRHPSLLLPAVCCSVYLAACCSSSSSVIVLVPLKQTHLLLIRLSGTDLHVFPWRRKPAHPLFLCEPTRHWNEAVASLRWLKLHQTSVGLWRRRKQSRIMPLVNTTPIFPLLLAPVWSPPTSVHLCLVLFNRKNIRLWFKNQNFDLKEAKSCRDKWQCFKNFNLHRL